MMARVGKYSCALPKVKMVWYESDSRYPRLMIATPLIPAARPSNGPWALELNGWWQANRKG
jgi:hypothetical protein